MADGQQHKNDANGQLVSRHSLPTLCFLSFFCPKFLKTILCLLARGTPRQHEDDFSFATTHKAIPMLSSKSRFIAGVEKHFTKLVK